MTTSAATDLCYTTAAELLSLYRNRTLSPVEVTRAVLDRIARLNPKLNAFLTVDEEGALTAARAAEAAYAAGNAGPLAGVPVSVKDLANTRGLRTTQGSLLYKDFVPEEDSLQVARLRMAGAVIVGKSNTPEFGSTPLNENRLGDSARNPWNTAHTTGGSSGGAGAAVATGMAPIGTGSDLGGSIRIPASACGVFGIKPTLGRVPKDTRANLTGEFFSHDGPLARTVADAALYLDVCAGPHPYDRFSRHGPRPDFAAALDKLPRGLRVAWSPGLGYRSVNRDVLDVCQAAVNRFASVVGTIDTAAPEGGQAAMQGFGIVTNAAGFDRSVVEYRKQHADLLTSAGRGGLDLPERTTLREYLEAIETVRRWRQNMAAFLEDYDLLLTPTLVTTAPVVGERHVSIAGGEPESVLCLIHLTAPFNLTGQPVASVPAGFADGLPVGLQFAGRFGDDLLVMQAARAFEQALPWTSSRPPVD